MSNLLKVYCQVSGQQISLQKSTVYFNANTPMALTQELSVDLEMSDRVLAKIMGWKQQFISQQCWRILHESDSLWVKVLKDRYFPQDSFLTAKRGGRASSVWSSLLEG
ncbi:hypothetical protein ACFX2G_035960 [Malus domestica]